jgi:hypothetical protein
VSKLPSTTTVTITTTSATTLNIALPVGPSSGRKQESLSAAEMDAIAQAYIKALQAQPGVVSVTLTAFRWTWLVSGGPARAAGPACGAWARARRLCPAPPAAAPPAPGGASRRFRPPVPRPRRAVQRVRSGAPPSVRPARRPSLSPSPRSCAHTPSPVTTNFAPPTSQSEKRMLVEFSVNVITDSQASTTVLLTSINSPVTPSDPQPSVGMCQAPALGGLCPGSVPGWVILNGCNTIKPSCTPPQLVSESCLSKSGAAAAFVTRRAQPSRDEATAAASSDGAGSSNTEVALAAATMEDAAVFDEANTAATPGSVGTNTPPRPQRPQQAQFVGCCVGMRPRRGAYGKMTCKHIRIGKRWQVEGDASGSGLLTRPVMKQVRGCQCFNIREYVHMDMFERPQSTPPAHKLAPYPFSVGIVSKVLAGRVEGRGSKGDGAHRPRAPAWPPPRAPRTPVPPLAYNPSRPAHPLRSAPFSNPPHLGLRQGRVRQHLQEHQLCQLRLRRRHLRRRRRAQRQHHVGEGHVVFWVADRGRNLPKLCLVGPQQLRHLLGVGDRPSRGPRRGRAQVAGLGCQLRMQEHAAAADDDRRCA